MLPAYYYYWYGKVSGSLKEDVYPSSYLWVSPEDLVHFPTFHLIFQDDFGLFMWLSGNDTRPPIHYDQDHNFYVHVAGT